MKKSTTFVVQMLFTERRINMIIKWKLTLTGGTAQDLNDEDLDYIAMMIEDGYLEGTVEHEDE